MSYRRVKIVKPLKNWRRCGLMGGALDSGASARGPSPGRGHQGRWGTLCCVLRRDA